MVASPRRAAWSRCRGGAARAQAVLGERYIASETLCTALAAVEPVFELAVAVEHCDVEVLVDEEHVPAVRVKVEGHAVLQVIGLTCPGFFGPGDEQFAGQISLTAAKSREEERYCLHMVENTATT